eukprot:627257-Heterocapsa_arctica.AAC.1
MDGPLRSERGQRICIPLDALIRGNEIEEEGGRREGDGPFGGDWAAACWNAQGLLAAGNFKQQMKIRRAARLTVKRDFV